MRNGEKRRELGAFIPFFEGAIPKVIDFLGPVEARTRNGLHLEEPSCEVHMEDLEQ